MSYFWAEVPLWVDYLFRGLMLFGMLCFSAVVLARTGRSPYWALLTILPFAAFAGIWALAFARWPKRS